MLVWEFTGKRAWVTKSPGSTKIKVHCILMQLIRNNDIHVSDYVYVALTDCSPHSFQIIFGHGIYKS